MQTAVIACRPPTTADGPSIWRLVRDVGVLDVNSTYCYLLLCTHFAETCCVAEEGGEVVGFVTAYPPPGRLDTLFVWQIGVSESHRGQGIASRLLSELLRRDACRDVRFVEATVGPTNHASRSLFTALARRLDAKLSEQPYLDTALFPQGGHEPENLLRVGPFSPYPPNDLSKGH